MTRQVTLPESVWSRIAGFAGVREIAALARTGRPMRRATAAEAAALAAVAPPCRGLALARDEFALAGVLRALAACYGAGRWRMMALQTHEKASRHESEARSARRTSLAQLQAVLAPTVAQRVQSGRRREAARCLMEFDLF